MFQKLFILKILFLYLVDEMWKQREKQNNSVFLKQTVTIQLIFNY